MFKINVYTFYSILYIYIYIYKNLFSMNIFYNNKKEQYIYFLPDLVLHLLTFLCYPIIHFSVILDLIKLCTHDFSRVTFTTELSTNIVYQIIFVIVYNYISIHLLFFFTVKLSICTLDRLCVKHKRVMSRSTHTEI